MPIFKKSMWDDVKQFPYVVRKIFPDGKKLDIPHATKREAQAYIRSMRGRSPKGTRSVIVKRSNPTRPNPHSLIPARVLISPTGKLRVFVTKEQAARIRGKAATGTGKKRNPAKRYTVALLHNSGKLIEAWGANTESEVKRIIHQIKQRSLHLGRVIRVHDTKTLTHKEHTY